MNTPPETAAPHFAGGAGGGPSKPLARRPLDDVAHGIAPTAAEQAWVDALHAAALFATDPAGTGGVALRAPAGPQRERWLQALRDVLPQEVPVKRVPVHVHDERLLGGLDLAATLRAGRPVGQRGLLAEADGGVLLLAMAERLAAGSAARIAAALDTGEVTLERDGLALRQPARLGVVALDEGLADDERLPAALRDRLAFHVELPAGLRDMPFHAGDDPVAGLRDRVIAARELLPTVGVDDALLQALCAAALALGIDSARAPLLALRVARAAAALAGRGAADQHDAALAARLVLAPRATQLPVLPAADDAATEPTEPHQRDNSAPAPAEPPPLPPPPPHADAAPPPAEAADAADNHDPASEPPPDPPPLDPATLTDLILEAAHAAIPAGLLAALKLGQAIRARTASAGRAGQVRYNRSRGRPAGVRRGEPRAGVRLNLIETLRAAAPWQAVRRREADAAESRDATSRADATGSRTLQRPAAARPRILVRRDDFHVTRWQQRSETTTVFVVDASGSAALHRLAEAKGAVELLLADCYVRRDRVALLAFRGKAAELLLPPTRSLVRAKRCLAGLPGGGGTPLAAGIDAAFALADTIARRGETPILVLLTDGRGNIASDGTPGRQRAGDDALAAARQVRLAGLTALLLDTSPQPQPAAEQLAAAMGAAYLPLPHAGAAALSSAVRLATAVPAVPGRP
jgi:magnesium chelatase subunit D